jgi:membrane-associated protease RseP (regulator of RpoE activity)
VPVNLARYIMERIISDGKVTRGYLGVKIQALTPELATQLKLSGQTGALVGEVTPNSPAEKAGLKKNDAIVEFDSETGMVTTPKLIAPFQSVAQKISHPTAAPSPIHISQFLLI